MSLIQIQMFVTMLKLAWLLSTVTVSCGGFLIQNYNMGYD